MFNLKETCNIKGYKAIPKNQEMFKAFLKCFINSWGLDARETIKPISVKFCKDKENGSYLRFDYEIYERKEWLHVTSVDNWY